MYVYLCVSVSVSVCSKKKCQKNPISTNCIYICIFVYIYIHSIYVFFDVFLCLSVFLMYVYMCA